MRFPVVLDFEDHPPANLQKALRKAYPLFGKGHGLNITDAGASIGESRYSMRSRDQTWNVSIGPQTLSLETTAYTVFEDFEKRLAELLRLAKPELDTDFFTRVGLRYINAVPLPTNQVESLAEWICPHLTAPLTNGVLGALRAYLVEIHGASTAGSYSFRYGFPHGSSPEPAMPEFVLDFDHYLENVELADTLNLVRDFRKVNYSFFRWALGPAAEKHLDEI